MKCLVTGSEGFIGKNLVAALKADGHEVVECDIKNEGQNAIVQSVFNDIDVVYHLACVNQMQAVQQPKQNLNINAFSTQKLAWKAAVAGAKFVYTSTASVYGNSSVIPTAVGDPLAPITDYAVAKLAGEYFVQNSDADWTILRLSNVYGPHQTLDNPYCGVIGRFINQALDGKAMTVIGDGTQTRDFSYVEDVVRHLLRVGGKCAYPEDFSGKILNVSSGLESSVGRIASEISMLTGAVFGTGTEKRVIDSVDRRLLVPDLQCYTLPKDGIKLTVDWFKSQRS